MEWIGTAAAALWWMLLGAAIGTTAFAAHLCRAERKRRERMEIEIGELKEGE